MSLLPLSAGLKEILKDYLPLAKHNRPFVTLTYAQSLDSRIAAMRGEQTKISHLETKTMTHYLRSIHSGIMVGIGTVLADDPKLNCRYVDTITGVKGASPRPIVLDPNGKWVYHQSQLRQICDQDLGLAPYIIIDESVKPLVEDEEILLRQGGLFVKLPLKADSATYKSTNWDIILKKLYELEIKSVMIEGGAVIINDLLCYRSEGKSIIDSLIITIGPVFLGNNGVEVSPNRQVELDSVKWWQGVQDSVLFARVVN